MKTKIFFLIAGLAFSMFSCNNDTVESIPNLPDDIDEIIAEIENFVVPLKEKSPETIVSQFESMHEAWEETWSRPEIIIYSTARKYAESEEYYSLLAFCKPYGKAIWPLVMEKLLQNYIFDACLLEDLTIPEYLFLFDESKRVAMDYNRRPEIIYSYLLLKKEEDNIREAVDHWKNK